MNHVRRVAALLAFAGTSAAATLGRAQEQGPDPEQIKEKVLEIERLMKRAEVALARSTDTRSAAERTAEAARKLLESKAQKETGKSSEQLRKEAEGGSKEASEALERLTKAANEEAKNAAEKMGELFGSAGSAEKAGQTIREVIQKIKGDGQGASDGIKWLLEKVAQEGKGSSRPSGGGGEGQGHKGPQPNADDPQKPDKKPDKPQDTNKKPESKTEPPRTPEFEQWYAELPPQVRKAYDSQDWDSIPPRWREVLKEWTKKLADDLEKERR